MTPAWQSLADELSRWRDSGRVVDFWWRDDDATQPSVALSRLTTLSVQAQVPLGLAVIPDGAEPALFADLGASIEVLQHGVDHRNRAAAGEKTSEFPATESPDSALHRIATGRSRLQALAGGRLLPVLVPPWNRFPATLVADLAGLGFRGYSTFAPRVTAYPADGLRHVNTHIDLIAWRRGRGFVGEERALAEAVEHLAARRTGTVDAGEPTGWLTHHACHDEALWSFLARLFEESRNQAGVRWLRPADVFAVHDTGTRPSQQ
ncbi:MAG: polysaccharide deacetylase family protein [Betaproteobacteria bacterium]